MEQQHKPTQKTSAGRSTQRTAATARPRTASASAGRLSATRTAGAAQKKKRQKVRFHNKNLKYQLLTVIAVVLAVVLCLVVFFRVNHINVRNNGSQQSDGTQTAEQVGSAQHAYYTAQEIEKSSGIELGDNLLTISKEAAAARIMAELPYISEVHIQRVLPGTVDITVSEFNVAYAVQDTANGWWLINRNGKVLERTNEAQTRSHLIIKGLRIDAPTPAKEIVPEQTEDMAEQDAKKTSLIGILQLMEAYDYCKQIVTVDLTSSYDIRFWYGTQFEIRIGNTEELAYKLAYLDGVLKELKSYQTGVIDLTFAEDKTARFQPFSD